MPEKLRRIQNDAAATIQPEPVRAASAAKKADADPIAAEATPTDMALTAKEKTIHEQGLVSVLGQLHDELDAAVIDAYGWSDLAPKLVGKPGGTTPYPDKPAEQVEAEEELLQRLVDLNAERAAEEARGIVRWLRPEFQNPGGEQAEQAEAALEPAAVVTETVKGKLAWPKSIADQVQAVRDALAEQSAEVSAEQLARQFKRAQTKRVTELLETLVALGQVDSSESGNYRIH